MCCQVSARGSIRREFSLITWVIGLQKLKHYHGINDASRVLRMYNEAAPPSKRIIGSRASALRSILEWNDVTIEVLRSSVSRTGWEASSWSEEALASKKIVPGSAFKSRDPQWTELCTVSEGSLEILVRHVAWVSEHKVGFTRKLDRASLEKKAEAAALVTHVKNLKTTSSMFNISRFLPQKCLKKNPQNNFKDPQTRGSSIFQTTWRMGSLGKLPDTPHHASPSLIVQDVCLSS